MTLTLYGRWQTRLLLFSTLGVLVTAPLAIAYSSSALFAALAYVTLLGLGWDILYNYMQRFRWDRDWPAAFQLLAGIWEAVVIAILFKTINLPGLPQETPLSLFAVDYTLVWLATFTAAQTAMRILFPRWRFHGGQWL
jgi:hypothetical protein